MLQALKAAGVIRRIKGCVRVLSDAIEDQAYSEVAALRHRRLEKVEKAGGSIQAARSCSR